MRSRFCSRSQSGNPAPSFGGASWGIVAAVTCGANRCLHGSHRPVPLNIRASPDRPTVGTGATIPVVGQFEEQPSVAGPGSSKGVEMDLVRRPALRGLGACHANWLITTIPQQLTNARELLITLSLFGADRLPARITHPSCGDLELHVNRHDTLPRGDLKRCPFGFTRRMFL